MVKLTAEQALDFSIKKWEAIVENDGQGISPEQKKKLGIWNFNSTCGLCEKYRRDYSCTKCPFIGENDHGCSNDLHIWRQWYINTTKENAQKVLDALKELKI